MKILFYLVVLFSCVVLGQEISTQSPKKFTFSSGYAEKIFNSNEGLVHFPLSTIDAYGSLFDITKSFSHSWISRLLIAIIELPISAWISSSVAIPFHEFPLLYLIYDN